ncbi:hypothetical protein JCM17961_50630 [Endothiovibrio diazotrophicus]
MDPVEICRQLEMNADIHWKAGDQKRSPKGRKLNGTYDHTYCVFRIDYDERACLQEIIETQNKKLSIKTDFLQKLTKDGGEIEYFIGWYAKTNTGDLFHWKLLKDTSDLHISLSFDVYCE